MVKGLSKRVIVVKSPDPQLFEEAIFIVRDEVFRESGLDSEQILKEAKRAAEQYLKKAKTKSARPRGSKRKAAGLDDYTTELPRIL